MELNITLVIQAVNFLCAYLCMRHFLFKPAIACAQAERTYAIELMAAINARKVIIEQKALEKEDRWKACHYTLAQHEPVVADKCDAASISSVPTMAISSISEQEIALAIEHSVAVMKKIGDLA